MGYLKVALSRDKHFRIYIVELKDTIEKARLIHNTSPLSTALLGRVMISTALLLSTIKLETDQKVGVDIECDGPAERVFCEITGRGRIRGYIANTRLKTVLRADDGKRKFNVAYAVGGGIFKVIKDVGTGKPYISTSPIVSGEIGQDLAYYLTSSEQIPSAVSLGVMVEPDGSVSGGAGILLQTMPHAEDEEIEVMERRFLDLPPMSSVSKVSMPLEEIISRIFKDYEIIGELDIDYFCPCNRETVKQFLLSLPKRELEDLFDKDRIKVDCKYCGKRYEFKREELGL